MNYTYIYIKNYMGKLNKQQQLKQLVVNDKLGSYLRGWINQEINIITNKSLNKHGKKRGNIRNPPGYDLAHERGRENQKGFGFEHTNLVLKEDHKIQHKFDNKGKMNKIRHFDIVYK